MKTLKEKFLEKFGSCNPIEEDVCDWWLHKRQSEFDELERRIREERVKYIRDKEDAADSGQFDVAYEQGEGSGFNKGLDKAISILNEMRGEK